MTDGDNQWVWESMLVYFQKIMARSNKAWHKGISLAEVYSQLIQDQCNVFIVSETYLVYVSKEKVWYGDFYALAENLVLKLNGGTAPFSVVPEALIQLATLNGCHLISVGTALSNNDAALARMYQAAGFNVEAFELTMEVPNG